MIEIWKDIPDYEGLYQVSNFGNLKSFKNGKEIIKKTYINKKNKYCYFSLYKNGKLKMVLAHRVVAEMFVDNPNNFKCVNHINEIKTDNRAENLEWCSYKYNLNYGTRSSKYRKKVIQYDLEGNFIKEWDSLKDTKNHGYAHVWGCCNNKRKSCGGYKWGYAEQ